MIYRDDVENYCQTCDYSVDHCHCDDDFGYDPNHEHGYN